jgi:hypothetical protein
VQLQWREPKTVHRARTLILLRGVPRWVWSLVAAALSGLFMAIWALAPLVGPPNPANGPPPSFSEWAILTTVTIFIVVYVAPWTALWSAPRIAITDKGIRWNQGKVRFWPYADILTATMTTRVNGGEPVRLLELKLRSGVAEVLGVALEISPTTLTKLLKVRSIQVAPTDRQQVV